MTQPNIQDFVDWLAKQPKDKPYIADDNLTCLVAEFMKAPAPVTLYYPLEDIVYPGKHMCGDALVRAHELGYWEHNQ